MNFLEEEAYWDSIPSTEDEEARMGARWVRGDGKPCPCGGSGWLITMSDAVTRCSCGVPAGRHPTDDRDEDPDFVEAPTVAVAPRVCVV